MAGQHDVNTFFGSLLPQSRSYSPYLEQGCLDCQAGNAYAGRSGSWGNASQLGNNFVGCCLATLLTNSQLATPIP